MAVRVGDGSHHAGVGVREVVAQDRRAQVSWAAEVTVPGTEVDRGRRRGVSHVLRVLDPITIAVDAGNAPRAGDELHRAHGPVVRAVPVEQPMIGIKDSCRPVRTIQCHTEDAWLGYAGRVQLVATKAPMVALDPSDGRQQCPVDVASRVG
jgi:hypothetical protein